MAVTCTYTSENKNNSHTFTKISKASQGESYTQLVVKVDKEGDISLGETPYFVDECKE